MRIRSLLILLPLLAWFTSTAHALPRLSADYSLTPEATNGGGGRTESDDYLNEGGLGDFGGFSTAASPPVAVTEGFDGDGDFTLEQLLIAGAYTLRVYREPGAGAGQAFDLAIDASVVATTRPDVAVGASPGGLLGVGVYAPTPQMVTLTSRNANPVTGHASIANRGWLPAVLEVNAERGNSLFNVLYRGPAGNNLTAVLIKGPYRTPAMDASDAPLAIRATVTPNKRKLAKKRGRRTTILRRSFTTAIGVRSATDPSIRDAGSIRVQTK